MESKKSLADLATDYDEGLLFLDSSQIGQSDEEVRKAKATLAQYRKLVVSVDPLAPWKTLMPLS